MTKEKKIDVSLMQIMSKSLIITMVFHPCTGGHSTFFGLLNVSILFYFYPIRRCRVHSIKQITLMFNEFSVFRHLYILLCTHTTCSAHWDRNTIDSCGGRNT